MELRDLYNINKEKTNETISSIQEISENRYILVELVLIQNSKGQLLIQKRSQQKGIFMIYFTCKMIMIFQK